MEVSENASFAVAFEFKEDGGLGDANVEYSVLNSVRCGVVRDEVADDFVPCCSDDLLIELANHSDFREKLAHSVSDV